MTARLFLIFRVLAIATFAVIFAVGSFEALSDTDFLGQNPKWLELVIVAISFSAGHVALSYVMILSDQVLRQNFPWLKFGAFTVSLFAGLWYFGTFKNFLITLIALKIFTLMRVYHGVSQAMGLSLVQIHHDQKLSTSDDLSSDRMAELVKDVRRFALLAFGLALLNPFFNAVISVFPQAYVPPKEFYLALSVILIFFFVRKIYRGKYVGLGHLILARMTVLPVKSGLSFGLSRAAHVFEFFYVFYLYARHDQHQRRRKKIVTVAIAAVVAVQLLFVYVHADFFGLSDTKAPQFLWALLYTFVVSHIVQDYILFNRNKVLSRRMRELLGVVAKDRTPAISQPNRQMPA